MESIFSGIRIIDLTKAFSGPFATRLFADYGAEVLKIENHINYDDTRDYPPIKNGWSGYYEIVNRNKKGISINLKNEEEKKKFYDLCKNADVIVENLTPKTKHSLKIDYETLKRINPRIIYASLSGISQAENKKYYDVIAQAESGLLSLTGTAKKPIKIGPSVVDAFAGLMLSFAISSALFYREKNGSGQYVDVSMLASAINLLESNLIAYSIDKRNPKRTENKDNLISPFGVYKTKNGFIAIAIGNKKQWNNFLQILKTKMKIKDYLFETNYLRLKNTKALTKIIERFFSYYPTKNLLSMLTHIEIPCSYVNRMEDVYKSDLLYRIGAIENINHPLLGNCVIPGRPILFSRAKETTYRFAPTIGQHNKEYGI